ncbi:MAG: class I SAM-dependent methyltransferase, partial [Sphingomonas sp.]|nr:class I SAM-dependent methyltransferase [Sphingomonas sp.]
PFVDAAQYLTERTGQSGQVSFQVGSALDLPLDAGSFDVVLLQHVAMNIADRDGLYRELHRVLKPAGRLALSEIVLNEGEPLYPVPWARTPETSFLLTASETVAVIEQAGFHMLKWQDETEQAKQWSLALRDSGPPPSPNLGLVMGPDYAELVGNLGRNINQGRLGVVAAVFEHA